METSKGSTDVNTGFNILPLGNGVTADHNKVLGVVYKIEAEEGANVTLNTDMQLVIKQRTEEFLITLDQALTASRRSTRPSGKIEEDQEGEAEAVFQPSARVAESKGG